jgi:hypothetical protein
LCSAQHRLHPRDSLHRAHNLSRVLGARAHTVPRVPTDAVVLGTAWFVFWAMDQQDFTRSWPMPAANQPAIASAGLMTWCGARKGRFGDEWLVAGQHAADRVDLGDLQDFVACYLQLTLPLYQALCTGPSRRPRCAQTDLTLPNAGRRGGASVYPQTPSATAATVQRCACGRGRHPRRVVGRCASVPPDMG